MSTNYRELILLSALAFMFHVAGGTRTQATVLVRPALAAQAPAASARVAALRPGRPGCERLANLRLHAAATARPEQGASPAGPAARLVAPVP
jgi:hypothetical protein